MMSYIPRLKKQYKEEIVPKMMEQFQYGSVMEVPKIVKVSINQGLGDATQDKKVVDEALKDLSQIAGQKAVPVKGTIPQRLYVIVAEALDPQH